MSKGEQYLLVGIGVFIILAILGLVVWWAMHATSFQWILITLYLSIGSIVGAYEGGFYNRQLMIHDIQPSRFELDTIREMAGNNLCVWFIWMIAWLWLFLLMFILDLGKDRVR